MKVMDPQGLLVQVAAFSSGRVSADVLHVELAGTQHVQSIYGYRIYRHRHSYSSQYKISSYLKLCHTTAFIHQEL